MRLDEEGKVMDWGRRLRGVGDLRIRPGNRVVALLMLLLLLLLLVLLLLLADGSVMRKGLEDWD